MSFWAYILRSEATGKLYIGHTSDLERRIREHNDPEVGRCRYTRKQQGPWRMIHSEPFSTRSEAMEREKYLKSGQGREWIRNHVAGLNRQSPPQADSSPARGATIPSAEFSGSYLTQDPMG